MTPRERRDCDRLAHSILTRAIARWRGSKARGERARELVKLDPAQARWSDLAIRNWLDDETAVLRAVLATDPEDGWRFPDSAEKRPRKPVGVRYGHEIFLAIPIPDFDDSSPHAEQCDKMTLVVIDSAAIRDINKGLAVADDFP